MKVIDYRQALNEALHEEMARDERVIVLGEDIGRDWEGAFKVSKGLAEKFGEERVRDTPISESCIVGAAVGAAMTGMRPVAEIMFGDLSMLAMDQIVNQAAKIRYMFGGQIAVPMVIRTPFGAGSSIASHHSQSLEAFFLHTPGLKVAVPSSPADAKGLLKTAIRDGNPVFFCEHKLCYKEKGPVPEGEHLVPFGKADVKRAGRDVTVVATMFMVYHALRAAEALAAEGIDVEVVDPRTLVPLDKETIANSVRKTGHAVIVSEDTLTGGVAAELASVIMEEAFDYLDAPVKRVCALDTPVPFSPVLEHAFLPDAVKIVQAVKDLL
ncbi:MAG: alpha-ketoacid dehydrogenase subunit beta [Planctomycetes bacterium]|nr:alpha-ketoacid dehydrogenase subunit beta [Planctomycetota bacterium]